MTMLVRRNGSNKSISTASLAPSKFPAITWGLWVLNRYRAQAAMEPKEWNF